MAFNGSDSLHENELCLEDDISRVEVMSSSRFQVSPTGAYANPQFMDVINEDPTDVQTYQPRRKSSILQRLFKDVVIPNERRASIISNEDIPRIDFYRNDNTVHKRLKRPDLEDLHMPQRLRPEKDINDEETGETLGNPSANKLGWVDGVYIRTMMNLFGVMLFLRMGWMAGQAGILLALAQILIATTITVITTLSMIALCTNGNIGGGGIYAMISRSVGHEAGGVIGFLFTFTNAAFVGLNLLGTAESATVILNKFDIGIGLSVVNEERIIGYICLMIIAVIPLISLEFEAKTLMFFFLTLMVSLVDYFVGALIPPTTNQMEKGFAYWKSYVISNNLYPRWDGYNFFQVFGVFFPSVTGIFTGASMSADLKNPAKAIPLGTFLAIATTSTTYAIIIIFTGSTIIAYSTGNVEDVKYNNRTCATECPFGLINDYQTMAMSGGLSHTNLKIDPLIYAGIFAATLSSALGCYTAAPRIFKAFADDNLFPYISWFGRGYGPANDPRHGYLVTFIIASIFIAIGDVNAAGVWIANFYLGAFFMVNFSLFHVSWVDSLSFRPSFKYYNKWISLIVGLVCIVLMFLFDLLSAAVVIGLTIIIYILMLFVNPVKANWGPSTEEQCFNIARCLTFRLNTQDDHVKHYRPMILLLCGNPTNRRALVDMANLMTKRYGILFLAHIAQGPIPYKTKGEITLSQKAWLRSKNIKAFYKLMESNSLSDGIKSLMQASGIGKFTPNIVMLGFKTNWQTCDLNNLLDYYEIIHSVLDCRYALIMFRLQEGHDFSKYFDMSDVPVFGNQTEVGRNPSRGNIYSISKIVDSRITASFSVNDYKMNEPIKREPQINIYEMANRFKVKQKKGNIDVWWIYDDGGLTLLMPYILKNNSLWKGCKLRVFSVTRTSSEIDSDQLSLTQLLKKFRIPYSDVHVLSDSDQPPKEETKNEFVKLISKSMSDESSTANERTIETLQNELIRFRDRTNRYLRLRELLTLHSKDSTLVVMTLPIPRKSNVSATLYMAWIEMLTKQMPPFLLIRGNQSNVLTFYC